MITGRIKNLLVIAYDLTIYIRHAILYLLFSKVCPDLPDKIKIAVGNLIFRRNYSDEVFANYKQYLSLLPGDLSVFESHMDPSEWLIDRTVLDLGSGLGRFSNLLVKQGARQVFGLEYQYRKINFMKSYCGGNSPTSYVCGSAEALPFTTRTFDTIFSFAVLEHVDDVGAVLQEIFRTLKDDGIAVIIVDFLTSRGGHHLHPYIHFPWPLTYVSEEGLCKYWSDRLMQDQRRGKMLYYGRDAVIERLDEGNEIKLNKITVDRFEELLNVNALRIIKYIPGERIAYCFRSLLKIAKIKDNLMGSTIYYLKKV